MTTATNEPTAKTPSETPEHWREPFARAWVGAGSTWDPIIQSAAQGPMPGRDDWPQIVGHDEYTDCPIPEGWNRVSAPTPSEPTLTLEQLWEGLPHGVRDILQPLAGAIPAAHREYFRSAYIGRLADALQRVTALNAREAELPALIESADQEVEDRAARLEHERAIVAAWDEDGDEPAPSHLPEQRARQRLREARAHRDALQMEQSDLRVASGAYSTGEGRLPKARQEAERLVQAGLTPGHWEGLRTGAEVNAHNRAEASNDAWQHVADVVARRRQRERLEAEAGARIAWQKGHRDAVSALMATAG
jgi:hypothetical protein